MTRMNRRDTASDLSPSIPLECQREGPFFGMYLQVTTYKIGGTRSQQEVNVSSQLHQKKTALTAL